MQMVTYSDLIQIGILVVGIINLFLSNSKKKYPPKAPQLTVTSLSNPRGSRLPAASPLIFIIPAFQRLSIPHTGDLFFTGERADTEVRPYGG